MRLVSNRLVLAVTVAAATAATAVPARAVDVPAYGVITITNDGLGAVPTWTYDPALWRCSTEFVGPFVAPSEVVVTCYPLYQDSSFTCPLMVLTTQTRGGRAGGSASCTTSLDTGIVTGFDVVTRRGNLGRVGTITCRAYGGGVPLAPPYTVTCGEPGLPTLTP